MVKPKIIKIKGVIVMPFVQAKCPECGGMLAVDDSKKAAVCQFCGKAFIVQEAINNYNTYNITNNTYNTDNRTTHNYGEGVIVNVYDNKSKGFLIEAGVLKEYHGASADVVIPDGVIEIGEGCFKGLKIKSVIIPEGVTSIGNNAFENCCYLEEVVLQEGLLNIGVGAFSNCSSLESITVPISVTSIDNEAFANCTSLSPVDVPKTLKHMANDVFKGVPYYDKKEAEAKRIIEFNNINKESFETYNQLYALGEKYKELDYDKSKEFGGKCISVASQWEQYEKIKSKYDECLSTKSAFFSFKVPMIIVGIITLLNGFIVWFMLALIEKIIRTIKVNKIKKSDNYLSDMGILKNRKEKIDGILEMIRRRDISGVNNSADIITDDLKLSCVLKKDLLRKLAESYEDKYR